MDKPNKLDKLDEPDDIEEQIIPLDETLVKPELSPGRLPFAKRLTFRQRKMGSSNNRTISNVKDLK